MNKTLKFLLKEYLIIALIMFAVYYGWQGIELLMIGRINPNSVDTVISWILLVSLYVNTWLVRVLRCKI